MSTHINAYFEDVNQAEARVAEAQAELSRASARLEAKKVEVGYPEPQVEVVDEPAPEKPKPSKKPKKSKK